MKTLSLGVRTVKHKIVVVIVHFFSVIYEVTLRREGTYVKCLGRKGYYYFYVLGHCIMDHQVAVFLCFGA